MRMLGLKVTWVTGYSASLAKMSLATLTAKVVSDPFGLRIKRKLIEASFREAKRILQVQEVLYSRIIRL